MQRGGTLRLLHVRPYSLDTALQEDMPPQQSDGLTNDALLAYARVGEATSLPNGNGNPMPGLRMVVFWPMPGMLDGIN